MEPAIIASCCDGVVNFDSCVGVVKILLCGFCEMDRFKYGERSWKVRWLSIDCIPSMHGTIHRSQHSPDINPSSHK